jgi:hypothetical protein
MYASQAFFYDWLDRNAAKKGRPLPEKIGSMQYFLHGFQGERQHIFATTVLINHRRCVRFSSQTPMARQGHRRYL